MNAQVQAIPTPAAQTSLLDTFSTQCVLIKLSAFAPSKTRTSKAATQQTHTKFGTNNGRYTASVMLPHIANALKASVQRARRYLDSNSIEFGEYRMVLLMDYAEVSAQLKAFAEEYVDIVRVQTHDWAAYRAEVEKECNGLWTEDLLPATQEDYVGQCHLRIQVLPLPANPTHIALPVDVAEKVETEIASAIHQQYTEILGKSYEEAATVLDETIERAASGKKVNTNTFNNVKATVERLAKFNLGGDERLGKVLEFLSALLGMVNPAEFNESEVYRQKVKTQLEKARVLL